MSYAPNAGGGSVFAFTAPLTSASARTNALDDHARARLARRRMLVVDAHATRGPALADQLDWWRIRTTLVADPSLVVPVLREGIESRDAFEGVLINLDEHDEAAHRAGPTHRR